MAQPAEGLAQGLVRGALEELTPRGGGSGTSIVRPAAGSPSSKRTSATASSAIEAVPTTRTTEARGARGPVRRDVARKDAVRAGTRRGERTGRGTRARAAPMSMRVGVSVARARHRCGARGIKSSLAWRNNEVGCPAYSSDRRGTAHQSHGSTGFSRDARHSHSRASRRVSSATTPARHACSCRDALCRQRSLSAVSSNVASVSPRHIGDSVRL